MKKRTGNRAFLLALFDGTLVFVLLKGQDAGEDHVEEEQTHGKGCGLAKGLGQAVAIFCLVHDQGNQHAKEHQCAKDGVKITHHQQRADQRAGSGQNEDVPEDFAAPGDLDLQVGVVEGDQRFPALQTGLDEDFPPGDEHQHVERQGHQRGDGVVHQSRIVCVSVCVIYKGTPFVLFTII